MQLLSPDTEYRVALWTSSSTHYVLWQYQYVAQANLEFMILLPQSFEFWDYGDAPPQLTLKVLIVKEYNRKGWRKNKNQTGYNWAGEECWSGALAK